MAKATNLWLCANRNGLVAYREPSLSGPPAVQWTLAYKSIRHVETGKERFDWFVRLHSEHSSRRANLGGNKPLAEEVARRLRDATSNPQQGRRQLGSADPPVEDIVGSNDVLRIDR